MVQAFPFLDPKSIDPLDFIFISRFAFGPKEFGRLGFCRSSISPVTSPVLKVPMAPGLQDGPDPPKSWHPVTTCYHDVTGSPSGASSTQTIDLTNPWFHSYTSTLQVRWFLDTSTHL